MKIKGIGEGKWGFLVEEANSEDSKSFKAITITEILKNSGHNQIDILKLDIESAEKEVFSSGYEEWLDNVNMLIIELHDRFKDGCSDAFYSAIKKYDFKKYQKGENIFLIKKEIAPHGFEPWS